MRTNGHQELIKRVPPPGVLTGTQRPNSVTLNDAAAQLRASDDVESRLYLTLDLILEAVAVAQPLHEEVAHFATLAALVTGERLGLSDMVVYRMRDSAIAEAKRNEVGKPRRLAKPCAKAR
jgi:hypothetical protein